MRQLVLEVPKTLSLSRKAELRDAVSVATAKALGGVECYKVDGACWAVQTQPTVDITARSLAFASAEESKKFAINFSTLQLSTKDLELVKVRNSQGRRRYASFFNRKDVDDGSDDSVFEEGRERNQEEMKSATWMIFAARAFVMRFYGLAKVRRALLALRISS